MSWRVIKLVKPKVDEPENSEFVQVLQVNGSIDDAEFPSKAEAEKFISTLRGGAEPDVYFEPVECPPPGH